MLKEDLKTEEFTEFGLPEQECVRIVGRIVNLNMEEPKLSPDSVGLFNLGDENNSTKVYRLKLNLSELSTFSLFEGEVVCAEGFMDSNSRFNVNRIHKASIRAPEVTTNALELERLRSLQDRKAMQVMVAAGPFTQKSNLRYSMLQDLMATVKRDQP